MYIDASVEGNPRIVALCRNCPICGIIAIGDAVHHNSTVYHSRCYYNSLVQQEYYNELSAYEELLANLHYLGYWDEE